MASARTIPFDTDETIAAMVFSTIDRRPSHDGKTSIFDAKRGTRMHTTEIKVRGYHLDVFGHVNNARYLEFLEEARWALFDEKVNLEDLAKDGFVFTVVNININYRRPAFLHDVLRVETGLARLGRRSAILRQTVKNRATGITVADAEVTFVMVAIEEQKAALLEGTVKEWVIRVLGK